jgi:hypothetical protein
MLNFRDGKNFKFIKIYFVLYLVAFQKNIPDISRLNMFEERIYKKKSIPSIYFSNSALTDRQIMSSPNLFRNLFFTHYEKNLE